MSTIPSRTPFIGFSHGQYAPLSFSQLRLWFLDQFAPKNSLYNIRLNLRLSGRLDHRALEMSLTELVRRHEVLRTNFRKQNGEPTQYIRHAFPTILSVIDLSELHESERELRAFTIAAEEYSRPFDLAHDSLLRSSLLRLGDEDHILLITVHHIVFDGWSDGVLRNELRSLYEAFSNGKGSPLCDLPCQYADFALWQRNHYQNGGLDRQLEYWTRHLSDAPVLELPTDHRRPPLQTFRGNEQSRTLPDRLVARLRQLSSKESCTLFMTLLAAFNVLLSRYSGQEDIVIGSAIAGRNWPEIEQLIGFFVNTIVLRTDLSGDPTFKELLGRIRHIAFAAYEHQDVPFEKIVEELRIDRNAGRSPVFQVMFLLQNAPRQTWSLPGLTVETVGGPADITKFDLTVTLTERPEGLRVNVSYNVDLFDEPTISRMLVHYQNILEGVVDCPTKQISKLPLLDTLEQHEIVVEWNNTKSDFPIACVHELFEVQASLNPDAVALQLEGRAMTYRELNRRANSLARRLREWRIGPESLVGICMERSFEMIVGFLGAMKAGGAYMPLEPGLPRERLAFMVKDAGLSVIVTQPSITEVLPRGVVKIMLDASDQLTTEDDDNVASGAHANNLAYVMYTSGSTGIPKGVEAVHRGIVRLLFGGGFAQFDNTRVFLHYTRPAFDASTIELWGALLHGGRCVLFPNKLSTPSLLRKVIDDHGVNVLWMTTPLFNAVIDEDPSTLAGIHQLFVGGEPLSVAHISRALEVLPSIDIINAYGPTENTVFTSTYHIPRLLDPKSSSIPIGKPIGNTEVYILDRQLSPVPVGVIGELYTGGDGLARGYLNQPMLTSEKFIRNPLYEDSRARMYRTGDLVRYLPDGNIDFVGRIDNQVKIRGFRVELGEIDNALLKYPIVQEAVTIAREDVAGCRILVAYVVTPPGIAVDTAELRSHLAQSLPDYMIPTKFIQLHSLPLTANGKVDRARLPAPNSRPDEYAGPVAPRNQLEDTVLRAWEQVLPKQPCGITDNFFDLGGHSLLAVKMLAEIEKLTGITLPLAVLFQNATVENLATLVQQQQGQLNESVVATINAAGSYPPFFGIVTPGGNGLGYVALSRHLGVNQPFYRIAGHGPRIKDRPYTTVEFETLAAQYIRAMKIIQPEGPYYLGGMCYGARLAFDMARLLEAEAETVRLLAIFDTWVMENTTNRSLWRINNYIKKIEKFGRSDGRTKVRMLRRWSERKLGLRKATKVWYSAHWPGESYLPPKYSGTITVFRTPKQPFYQKNDRSLGWKDRTTGAIELLTVECAHRYLLREPYVQSLATQLGHCLTRVRAEVAQYADALPGI